MANLNLALIGNCSYAALLDRQARIVWACLSRLDGDPVFCDLLQPTGAGEGHGFFQVELLGYTHSEQRYLHNSAILVTRLHDANGGIIELTDFAPRFKQYDRVFRPAMFVRHVQRIEGEPRIRIRMRPLFGYGSITPQTTHGSNHIRYLGDGQVLRLTTDAPISYIREERPFVLEQPIHLMLGPDESLTASLPQTAREFFDQTRAYWREWCRFLAIPFEWQADVIRAAVTLKLCSFEETGAIVAAVTTSIPEAANTERNWDYRFCWLRDAWFVVHALNRLGATKTMEEFLYYIDTVIANATDGHLQPVYGISAEAKLVERHIDTLAGYRGMGPVRVGNQAYEQIQNDSYGAVLMAVTQMFFDRRLERPGTPELFKRMERVGDKAVELFDKPDAGLWELRGSQKVHTFSSVMCWTACDRLAKIAAQQELPARAAHWRESADRIREVILENAWDEEENSFVASFGGKELDAVLLLLNDLGFIASNDPRYIGTVEAVERHLRRGDHVFRYTVEDDFGFPENAFNVCTFWYIDALAAIGRVDEARELFEKMLASRNHLGLLSEDIDVETGELWGNYPQTYSMVGLINSAWRLSRDWEEAF